MKVEIQGSGLSHEKGMCLLVKTGKRDSYESTVLDYGMGSSEVAFREKGDFLRTNRMLLTHADGDHFQIGKLLHNRATYESSEPIEIWGPVGMSFYVGNSLNSCCYGERSDLVVDVYEIEGGQSKKIRFTYQRGPSEVPMFVSTESFVDTPIDGNGIVTLGSFGQGGHTTVKAVYGRHGERALPVVCFAVEEKKRPKVNMDATRMVEILLRPRGPWMRELNDGIMDALDRYDGGKLNEFLYREVDESCLPSDKDGKRVEMRTLLSGKGKAIEVEPPRTVKLAYVTDTVLTRSSGRGDPNSPLSALMREGQVGNEDALIELARGADYLWCGTKPDRSRVRVHLSPPDVVYLAMQARPKNVIVGHLGMDHESVVGALKGAAAENFSEEMFELAVSRQVLRERKRRGLITDETADALGAFRNVRKGLKGACDVRLGFAPYPQEVFAEGLLGMKSNYSRYLASEFAAPESDMDGFEQKEPKQGE